jgi:hypothetical protein
VPDRAILLLRGIGSVHELEQLIAVDEAELLVIGEVDERRARLPIERC